jgi:hypothetical protein
LRPFGPVFVTERKARVQLPAAGLDERGRARFSYQQAEALFPKASAGATLHQLRHQAERDPRRSSIQGPVGCTRHGDRALSGDGDPRG